MTKDKRKSNAKRFLTYRHAHRSILNEKWKEAFTSVLPITLIVLALCFIWVPAPVSSMLGFLVGAVMLVVGMGLFTLGTDLAMTPIGEHVGSAMTRSKKVWLIMLISFLVGVIITISEHDLQVLAEQVPGVPPREQEDVSGDSGHGCAHAVDVFNGRREAVRVSGDSARTNKVMFAQTKQFTYPASFPRQKARTSLLEQHSQ